MDTVPTLSLLDALARLRPKTSRSDLRRLLAAGRVTVNGRVNKIAKTPVGPDEAIAIRATHKPEPRWPFTIVYADDDLLVIDKPAGLLTSSVPREKRPTALAIALAWATIERPRAKVGLVHRLDADASGVLVFSLNNAAYSALKSQFADHSASRTYVAIVESPVNPPAGTIRSLLAEHADGTVHTTTSTRHGDAAITYYETVATAAGHTHLRVTLETGRKHQIRTHLAGRGWPIIGDRLYGGAPATRLMLAAIRLELSHPCDGVRVTFDAPLPPPMIVLSPPQ